MSARSSVALSFHLRLRSTHRLETNVQISFLIGFSECYWLANGIVAWLKCE